MRLTIVLFILLFHFTAYAQSPDLGNRSWLITPGISVGYTFGAYFTVGVELNTGYNLTHKNESLNMIGASLQYSAVLDYYAWHQIITVSGMYRSKALDFRAGMGRALIWHGRLCHTDGFHLEGSVHLSPLQPVSTWLGMRAFITGDTSFFDYPSYTSLFARYQYE